MTLVAARKAALSWTAQAEEKFDMACTYEEGTICDQHSFTRSGVTGTLMVDKDTFELKATLGFFLGAFKDKIESEIVKNLDALIDKKEPITKKVATRKLAVKKA